MNGNNGNGINDQPLLDVLTRRGVLISASVRYWRGCKKLKAEDLGLNPDNVSDRLISLGHKRLLPKEAIQPLATVEAQTHALIESASFPFLNGIAHFLPNARLQEVTGRLNELQGDFWRAKEGFLGRYGDLRTTATREWRDMAARLSGEPDRLMEVIESSFPEAGSLERTYGFDVQMFNIRVPEKFTARLMAEGEQREIVEARNTAAKAAAEKIRNDTQAFVTDCVTSLRRETADLCTEILESIRTGKTGGVHQKTLNRLARFIEGFRGMNFANDRQLEETLENARRELLGRTAEEYRDNAGAQVELTRGITRLRDAAREMLREDAAEVVRRFGEMGSRKFHLAA